MNREEVFVAKIQQLELIQMFPGDLTRAYVCMFGEKEKIEIETRVIYASIHDLNISFISIVFPSR